MRILLLICFFAMAGVARANTNTDLDGSNNGLKDISGGVIDADSKKPLTNVNVIAVLTDTKEKWTAVTDQNGNYSFNNLKEGNYKLVFQKDGFKKIIKEKVFVKPDENVQLNTEMAPGGDFQIIPGLLLFNHFE